MPSLPTEEEGSGGNGASPDAEVLRILGLARRAGSVVTGSQAVKGAARARKLRAAILARDASDNARARVEPLLEQRGVRVVYCGSRATLGAALGKAPIAVIGITDAGLAEHVLATLQVGRR